MKSNDNGKLHEVVAVDCASFVTNLLVKNIKPFLEK